VRDLKTGGILDASWTVPADIEEEEEASSAFIDKLRCHADAERRVGSEQHHVSRQHVLDGAA